MKTLVNFKSFQDLFEKINHKKGRDGRSVYSPAAYFSDLLQLLEDKFGEGNGLFDRRPDVKDIPLNGEFSFTQIAYLDIVNKLLENKISSSTNTPAYQKLQQVSYPMHLPFHLGETRFKQYLKYVEVEAQDIYKLFSGSTEGLAIARAYLNLSEETLHTILSSPKDVKTFLKEHFGLEKDYQTQLKQVENFLKLTQLSFSELTALLYQKLSVQASRMDNKAQNERGLANQSFVNFQTSGYARLTDPETESKEREMQINWGKFSNLSNTEQDWFKRIRRSSQIIRLAQSTGLSITELDLIIRQLCEHQLDAVAIQKIAIVKFLSVQYDLSVASVVALLSHMNTRGIGDQDRPQDLFDQIFNNNFTDYDKQYILGAAYVPAPFKEMAQMQAKGDLLAPENYDYRKRVGKALRMSERNLRNIVERFRSHFGDENPRDNFFDVQSPEARPALDVLYRMSLLTEIMDVSYLELFDLLDILAKEAAIRPFAEADSLIYFQPGQQSPYSIIQGKSTQPIQDLLWLVQTLIALGRWMQQSDFSAAELKQIMTGRPRDEKEATAWKEQKLNFLNSLYEQFLPLAFQPQNFTSERFSGRESRAIYRSVSDEAHLLTAPGDDRIVRLDNDRIQRAARQAIEQLDVFSKKDFLDLGIEEKMAGKIFNNLVIKGFIQADGTLIETAFPDQPESFKINSDSVLERNDLFATIHQLVNEELGSNGSSANGGKSELSLFPSDLEDLELSEPRKKELYDNLIFNGYLDDEGHLIEPGFFKKAENAEKFESNANIDQFSQAVYDKIRSNINCYREDKLFVTADDFTNLALTEIETHDLVENLKFNEYLHIDASVADKDQLLNLLPEDINLTIQFYPLRSAILETLQSKVAEFKANYYTLSKEMLMDTAAEIVAQTIHRHLEENFLSNGRMTPTGLSLFKDPDNAENFSISPYLTDLHHQAIFRTIREFIDAYEKYQLTESDLESLELEKEHLDTLQETLHEMGYLEDQKIAADQRALFLNVNNALTFELEEYADFSKDIFFILHTIARETDAAISEVSQQIGTIAEAQESMVYSALGEYLELSPEITRVVVSHLFKSHAHLPEIILLPILGQVDEKGKIKAIPGNVRFNNALQRMRQTALLINKLGLNARETEVVFNDQSLTEKMPEKLHLPEGEEKIDALLSSGDHIYLFAGNRYWSYSADHYTLLESAMPLSSLSEKLAVLTQVDAAFTDATGREWIMGRSVQLEEEGQRESGMYFCRTEAESDWEAKDYFLGKVKNNFEDPDQIDASFVDHEGKVYLFAGDQYMRYSEDLHADEGYPKYIQGNWKNELSFDLPEEFYQSIDASFTDLEGQTYIFKGEHFVSSANYQQKIPTGEVWGRVNNSFARHTGIDTLFPFQGKLYFLREDQLIAYTDSIENDEVMGDPGSLTTIEQFIPALPDDFESDLDAVLKGADGQYYFFKNKKFVALDAQLKSQDQEVQIHNTERRWGRVRNNILTTGQIDAALAGLDGRAYLFSGDQYFRYSKADYSKVDEGYPRSINKDWSGMSSVEAAFVLDGRTYLIGKDDNGSGVYLSFSDNDYSVADQSTPVPLDDNWWNLPNNLLKKGFDTPDAIFVGRDKNTYLFKGKYYISYDSQHRWWSEPQLITQRWDSLPFEAVTAAFTGKDGRTYIFEKQHFEDEVERSVLAPNDLHFVRYSDPNYNKIDDRYPKSITRFWGKVVNNIQKTKRIDACTTLLSRETQTDENGEESTTETLHTYLFSGKQFFRYSGNNYHFVDEGYPRSIKSQLLLEPRFKHLREDLSDGLNALHADQRNVYLFKGEDCLVLSEEGSRSYTAPISGPIRAAILDEGSLYVLGRQQWFHLSAVENQQQIQKVRTPPAIKKAPAFFQSDVAAILKGIDQNTYIFKQGSCYNTSLERAYPIGEEWGRTANRFQIDRTVDAAFVGQNGKIYLFSGEQFVSYTPTTGSKQIPEFIDTSAHSIAEHWGGLHNVQLAFVMDEKTYLMEAPDEDGVFRYHCYRLGDYGAPDMEEPLEGDITWWDMPLDYIEAGFDEVQAVLFDEDNMFLLNEDSFVQYNQTEQMWTYPRPLHRLWRDLPQENSRFEKLKTAFTGPDDITRFFSHHYYVEYRQSVNGTDNALANNLQKIENRWGIEKNNIVRNNRIDAAVVVHNTYTYLFSGEQYVRYSGEDYQFVDEGYPKAISGHLRKETGFEALSIQLEKTIGTGQHKIAIVGNEHNIYIFENNRCHVVSDGVNRRYKVSRIGQIRNNIAKNNLVDAAFVNDDDDTYLFSGDQLFKYTGTDYEYVDEGYPKSLEEHLDGEGQLAEVKGQIQNGVDAAFKAPNGHIYLFREKRFYTLGETVASMPVKDLWGKVQNHFLPSPHEADTPAIDAAMVTPEGKTYFFKGDQYLCYSHLDNEFADEGFPRRIRDNWGNLFPGARINLVGNRDFEAQLDGAFTFEGNTYFCKGAEYVRYANSDFSKMNHPKPWAFRAQWTDRNDFLLNDLKIISEYKMLQDQHQGAENTLTDFFYEARGYQKDPYQMLADIFNWPVEEVKWLKRNNAFLSGAPDSEVRFDLEQVLAMQRIFQLSEKMGFTPSQLYEKVWVEKFKNDQADKAAQALYTQLGLNNTEKDWEILSRQIHDEMNLIRRDALLPYMIYLTEEVEDARDLFEYLLIDVEMGSEAKTSEIKEATAAVQLYFHRYFVNLEEIGDTDEDKKAELRDWWKWMKNFRVWEANRKVFLYPENYIRPELRDTKTPEFKKLEESLHQGIINQENVARNFKQYLDTFTTVGNLKIAGANIYKDGADEVLILFGHTRTEPAEYYYRTARFAYGAVEWSAWSRMETSINASRVYPVYANGRILVFWVEVEEYEDAKGTLSRKKEDSEFLEANTDNTAVRQRAHIKYSYYDHNQRWSPPQIVRRNIDLAYKLDAAYVDNIIADDVNNKKEKAIVVFSGNYCLASTTTNPAGDVKLIKEYKEFKTLPEEFQKGVDAVTIFNKKRYFFKGDTYAIQDAEQNTILYEGLTKELYEKPKVKGVVLVQLGPLGLATKPAAIPTEYNLPTVLDAAFTIKDGLLCLIDKKGNYSFYLEKVIKHPVSGAKELFLDPILDVKTIVQKLPIFNFQIFMQTIANKGGQFAPADGVFNEDNTYYVLRNGQYECYELDKQGLLTPIEGFPKSIKGNLSFNMDEFFNQLQVVWREHDGGYVRLNYTTSKDKILLSGKLHADFSFEENELRNSYPERLLIDIKNRFSNDLMVDYKEDQNKKARKYVDDLKPQVKALQNRTVNLNLVKAGVNDLAQAIHELRNNQQDRFEQTLSKAIPNLVFVNTLDLASLTALKSDADKLKTDYSAYKDLEDEAKTEAWDALMTHVDTLRNNIQDSVMPDLNSKIRELKDDIHGLHLSYNDDPVPLNFIYRTSENINQFATARNKFSKIAKDNQLGVPVLTPLDSWISLNGKNYSQHLILVQQLELVRNVATDNKNGLSIIKGHLDLVAKAIKELSDNLKTMDTEAAKIEKEHREAIEKKETDLYDLREEIFGRQDLFHNSGFNIDTKSNFSFGRKVDWYIFEADGGTFLARPLDEKMIIEEGDVNKYSNDHLYEIIRLTTNTIPQLSTQLFTEGLPGLLSLNTQEIDELPGFGSGQTISYHEGKIKSVPKHEHLDFTGANKTYFWEIFFHAPFLIAQALNTEQKFAEAKEWYEFIFDPTQRQRIWRFLPFDKTKIENAFISDPSQLRKYYNDPFDPHAIAGLRINAYRKAIVMNYIDNLLDWGDMLFRQYTMESINEARMLYILAYDLLGKRPPSTGDRILSADQTYQQQKEVDGIDLKIWDLENEENTTDASASEEVMLTPSILSIHDSNLSAYFFIPENELFLDYWDRVEDRLYKIRHSLNIKGIKQPLPLFQPPIDPMALVQAAGSGAGFSAALSSLNVAAPHYRFKFLVEKAKELVGKLNQFGGELLSSIEKRDSEELSVMQTRQEGLILNMSRGLRESQIQEVDNTLKMLTQSLEDANWRLDYHKNTIEADYLPAEEGQLAMMSGAVIGHTVASIFNILSVVAYPWPDQTIGPFSFGVTNDTGDIGEALSKVGEAASSVAEGMSILGELSGMVAQHQRMQEDWEFQKATTEHEITQMKIEIQGMEIQKKVAQLELEIYEKELENQQSIQTFYKEKFSNQELYKWMISRLSGLYYQTYQMAFELAKSAEKALQFERGAKASELNFIQGGYWNSQRKGLLAGESLGLDLDRMEKAYYETNQRRLEISKRISLVQLDPLAFVQLIQKGRCEFRLSEALFDYDFQGHYCRQIKTISLTLTAGEGQTVNATLTQLNHRTIMEPDAKAVKFLLDPKDQQPLSIRSDWKAHQQIALSHVGQYEESNGMFELRFDDERYLPFEGTGAVSTWRLELNGKRGSFQIGKIKDVVMTVKYTAIQGGEAFANSVKGLLKPYPTAMMIDVAQTFPDQWSDFVMGNTDQLELPLTRAHFPNISGGKISGMLAKFELLDDGTAEMILNGDDAWKLKDGKYLDTAGLSISGRGSTLKLALKGNREQLENAKLVFGYKAAV